MAYELQRQVAIEAVIRAAKLCQAVQVALVDESTLAKKDKSPVTVADFGAQAVVTTALQGAFAGVPLVGEEDAEKGDDRVGIGGVGRLDQRFGSVSFPKIAVGRPRHDGRQVMGNSNEFRLRPQADCVGDAIIALWEEYDFVLINGLL